VLACYYTHVSQQASLENVQLPRGDEDNLASYTRNWVLLVRLLTPGLSNTLFKNNSTFEALKEPELFYMEKSKQKSDPSYSFLFFKEVWRA
jgi:hypothetical protein